MTDVLLVVILVFAVAGVVLAAVLLVRQARGGAAQLLPELRRVESAMRDEFTRQRGELAEQAQRGHDAQALRQEEARRDLRETLDSIRATMEQRLERLQTANDERLEAMRRTVEEKLQSTLEARLGESFKLVSERLEQVHRGLGEMQSIAGSVGDLKRVLTNVKTRGTWGEVQLGNLLEQVLTPEQFARNQVTRPGTAERVEFAIRLPGRDDDGAPVWLPVDSKFPIEDYERLITAAEAADAEGVAVAGKALEDRVRLFARMIREKYVEPPHTTDFAVLFLPSEGLYAEVLRRPGLAESLQREQRVTIAGPATLAAMLNSLQMGFRTLAIQKRSSEVWEVLGAVKTEFGRFADVLDKVRKKLEEASGQIEQTGVRTRAIERKLRGVEALPDDAAARLIPRGAGDESAA
jgi:DNA recombination protein RmuC